MTKGCFACGLALLHSTPCRKTAAAAAGRSIDSAATVLPSRPCWASTDVPIVLYLVSQLGLAAACLLPQTVPKRVTCFVRRRHDRMAICSIHYVLT